MLQEQRIDLIHAVDDIIQENQSNLDPQISRRQNSQGLASGTLTEPKATRRPVKLITFKKLNKYYQAESKPLTSAHIQVSGKQNDAPSHGK